jgi:hypothetical protein
VLNKRKWPREESLSCGAENTLKADSEILRNVENRQLIFGPYVPPRVEVGDQLQCQIFGLQIVKGWLGPMQWPRAACSGRPRLIICSELMRAIVQETIATVSLQWGIHTSTIKKWRRRIVATGLTAASAKYRAAKMRSLRHQQPQTYVSPGLEHLAHLSGESRVSLGLATAGQRAWSSVELEQLPGLTNKRASAILGRSVKSVASARQRHSLSYP